MVTKPTKKRSSPIKKIKKKINQLSRDEKVELLWQLNCAYFKIYNMECLSTKQELIQSDAICELARIHNIVKKSLQ